MILDAEAPISVEQLRATHEGWLPAYMAADAGTLTGASLPMPMSAAEIERVIRDSLPDAQVTIEDLAGDGDHYRAHIVSGSSAASRGCSSISSSIRRWATAWAASCTPWR